MSPPLPLPSRMPSQRVRSLDGLRGVAALVVLVHHLLLFVPAFVALQHRVPSTETWAMLMSATPLHLLWAGDEAVIAFFVLSGFALATPALLPSFRWVSYFSGRGVRLYLPVAAAVLLSAGILVAAPASVAAAAGAFAPRPGAVDLSAVLRDATLVTAPTALNNPLWSLHYELAFSVLLPIQVLAARRLERPWLLLAGAIGASTAGLLLASPVVQFLPVFLIGVLYAHHRQHVGAWVREALARRPALGPLSAAAVAGLLPVMWYPLPPRLHLVIGWPLLLVAAGVLVVLAAEWAPLASALTGRAAARLGALSFSLYLTHMPVLLGLRALLGPDSTAALLVIGGPTAIAVAMVFHRLVERPSHRLARQTGTAAAALLPALGRRRAEPATGSMVDSTPHRRREGDLPKPRVDALRVGAR